MADASRLDQGRFRAQRPWFAPALLPLAGIALLLIINVAADMLREPSPGMFGPGAFLHIRWQDGAPVGAIIDILNHASKIIILALGMAIVIATRGIDLSVGSTMAIAGAVAAMLTVGGIPSAVAVMLALGVAMLCGLLNGVLVANLGLQPFVATLVLMVAGRGVAQMLTDGQVITFQDPLLTFVGNGKPWFLPLPMPILIAGSMLIGTAVVARTTTIGTFIEVVGCNPLAARLSGVRSKAVIALAYGFCGLCAGVAGLIVASNIKAADPHDAGMTLELSAIFAVVIGGGALTGGRFSLFGAAFGAILMQTLTATMYARNISAEVAPLPIAMVILAVCAVGSPTVREWWRKRSVALGSAAP